jgi:hypothetical protein
LYVRETGQFSHDQLELSLLKERYGDRLCGAVFQYAAPSDRGLPRPEPLSWHLTTSDKKDLREAWNQQESEVQKVMQYLQSGSCSN